VPFRPRDLSDRMARQKSPDGFVRETFSLPREQARAKARAFLKSYPNAAYMSEVERGVSFRTARSSLRCAGCGQQTDVSERSQFIEEL
jgi:hypothetical protein